jgi:hypothetical protein
MAKAKLTDLADFENQVFTQDMILEWAKSESGGGLPSVSARPFAEWIDRSWNDFDDGEGKLTNEDVLKGAQEFWTGRS